MIGKHTAGTDPFVHNFDMKNKGLILNYNLNFSI